MKKHVFETGDVVTRNNNFFIIKRDKYGHYFTSMLLGGARVTAWHRTPVKRLLQLYEKVENYDPDKNKFKW